MVNKQKEKYSISLIFREMTVKTKVRNHFTITRMAMSKKTDNTSRLVSLRNKLYSHTLGWEYIFLQPLCNKAKSMAY